MRRARARSVLALLWVACGCETPVSEPQAAARGVAAPVTVPALLPGTVPADPAARVVAVSVPALLPGMVPADPAAIPEWLQSFGYRVWAPQTDIRMAGEHGGERLYFNDLLTRSVLAGAAEHPIGSAAVRELYSADLRTLKGFALMHKTGPSGPVGEGWFWFEVFGTNSEAEPTVAQTAARGCVGCHSHAVDFVHSIDTPREDPQPLL